MIPAIVFNPASEGIDAAVGLLAHKMWNVVAECGDETISGEIRDA